MPRASSFPYSSSSTSSSSSSLCLRLRPPRSSVGREQLRETAGANTSLEPDDWGPTCFAFALAAAPFCLLCVSAGTGPCIAAGLIAQLVRANCKVRGSSPRGTNFSKFNIYACHALRQATANCSLSTVPISIVSLLIGPLSHCRLPHAPIDPLFHFPMQASGNCSASTVPISIVSLIIGPLSHCRLSHAAIVPLSNFPLTTPACSNPPAVVFRYTVDIATARHASR